MSEEKKILITLPKSPYKVLKVPFNADDRVVQDSFRSFFRGNPNLGVKIGKSAQKKLIDPKERIKVDAFCCEVDLPNVDLLTLKEHLKPKEEDIYCQALQNPVVLSDLYYSDNLPKGIVPQIDFGEIPYRNDYANKKAG